MKEEDERGRGRKRGGGEEEKGEAACTDNLEYQLCVMFGQEME